MSELSSPAPETIAVVIVGRDPGEYLRDALDSLVCQSSPPDEIIYYDDASSDNSVEIAQSYRKELKNFQVAGGEDQIGIAAARNRANALVQSGFIAVLDADDTFLPETIENYRKSLDETKEIDLLYADTVVFKNNSNWVWRLNYPPFESPAKATRKVMTSPILPFKHSSMVYRKTAVEEIGGYSEDLPLKVDFELFVRCIKNSLYIYKLDLLASRHRSHHKQVSRKRLRGIAYYWKIIDQYEFSIPRSVFYKTARTFGELAKFAMGK